jgi:hypothetical protein
VAGDARLVLEQLIGALPAVAAQVREDRVAAIAKARPAGALICLYAAFTSSLSSEGLS